ncbi:MAG: hypothetical protein ACN0LA_04710 [Candidatus Longimicrobiales bacterium M2_2A_002]
MSLALAAAGLAVLPACERAEPAGLEPTTMEVGHADRSMHEAGHGEGELDAHVRRQLASLRRLTAPFHQIDAAMAAGWDTPVTDCLSHPTDGAMGVHYGNLPFFDAEAAVLEPETLLYEPTKNGKMRLVGVEYLIPFTELPATAEAPELLGQHFHANTDAGVWALHVWLWRHNPEGLFADWNANVTCAWDS